MSSYFERIKFVSNQTVDYLIIPYIILPDCIISNIQLKSMRKWKLLCRFMMNVSIVIHTLGGGGVSVRHGLHVKQDWHI